LRTTLIGQSSRYSEPVSNRGPDVLLEPEDVEQATARIDGRVHVTPTMSVTTLGDELGVRLHLKAELSRRRDRSRPAGCSTSSFR
jgi:hypothetical protein